MGLLGGGLGGVRRGLRGRHGIGMGMEMEMGWEGLIM